MEDLLAELLVGLLELLLEVVVELVFGLLFGMVVEAIAERWEKGSRTIPLILLALLGIASGFLSATFLPHRIISRRTVPPGISLLLAPLATGAAMHLIGKGLRRLGRNPTNLATFAGGAIFAFSMALVRWLLVARA